MLRISYKRRRLVQEAWLWLYGTIFVSGILLCPLSSHGAPANASQVQTFSKGSLIIPMDTTYQDMGMLKAYGLLFQLLKANIPVNWVIKRNKKLGDADMTASAKDIQTGAVISKHGYRGGPFVVEAQYASQALAIIKVWQAKHTTTVHQAEADFSGRVGRLMTAAPTIAVFADGNEKIAFQYLNAAQIPDSKGNAWPEKDARSYPNHPDVLTVPMIAGPTTTSHRDGALFRSSGLPAYCQVMTMHWGVKEVVPEVVAEYREFLKHPTHMFAHCQAVNAVENHSFGRFLTPKGFVIDNKLSGKLSFFHLDTPFAQMDGAFQVVGGSERAYSLPPGDTYKTRNVVMITDAANGPGQRDVWMTGYLDGKCVVDEDEQGCTAGVGKVSYLGGHAYDTALPMSKNPNTQGTRLFLNSLFEASCVTEEGQPRITLLKKGPSFTTRDQITYTLYYGNYGAGPALDLVLTDTLPAGATYVSSTQQGQLSGNTVTWRVGDLGSGQTGSVQVTVKLAQYGVYQNQYKASFRVGVSTWTATSNQLSTTYQKALPPGPEPPPGDGGNPPPDGPELPDGPPANLSCMQPNLLLLLDRSGSMKSSSSPLCPHGDCTIRSQKTCQTDSDCTPMIRTHQPTPGSSPQYTYQCKSNRCHYSRWDIAQNTLKELVYQYGGSAPTFSDRKIRFGLLTFNNTTTVDQGMVANPLQIQTALNQTAAGGGTNYASAFVAAHQHLAAALRTDPNQQRPTYILFITDGRPNEGCDSSVKIVNDLYQGSGAYGLQDQQGNKLQVRTYVIGFGSSLDPDAQKCLDRLAVAGGTQRCKPGLAGCVAYYVADNEALLSKALQAITAAATQEVCDGLDNNCDGAVDEGLQRACKTTCGAGTESCRNGAWVGCTAPSPQAEVCDGVDNNCDGKVDEGCSCKEGETKPCYTGPSGTQSKGRCRGGTQRCVQGQWSTACQGEIKPATETCNGQDDNCDGQIDEDCQTQCKEGDTRPCPTRCGPGHQLCTKGSWSSCKEVTQLLFEVCDEKDNDCDGQIDENLVRSCKTSCGPGMEQCIRGRWSSCQGQQPGQEVCDGIDNDCDGKIDTNAQCPSGGTCFEGICLRACRQGECPGGQICREATCYPKTSCAAVRCRTGQICRGGQCIAPCSLMSCSSGLVCWQGQCVPPDCYHLGCPHKQLCRQGRCVDDPCASIQCAANEACKDGRCFTPCAKVTCQGKTSCQEGKCVPDDCAGVTCPTGKVCFGGTCHQDPCEKIACPAGRVCRYGECIDDPCAALKCPKTLVCQDGRCVDLCTNKSCSQGKVCIRGNCVPNDCYHAGCPDGKICRKGTCTPDPCLGKTCSKKAFCRDGTCVASCIGVTCPTGQQCIDGACEVMPCYGISCEKGLLCHKGRCMDDLCKTVTCDPGRICDRGSGTCVDDPCNHIQCPTGGVCDAGQCIDACLHVSCPQKFSCIQGVCQQKDCYTQGCPASQICRQEQCVPNPCNGVTCQGNQFCREGKCVNSCAGVTCAANQHCIDGDCQPNPCAGVQCASDKYCNKGKCEPDQCRSILCGVGRECDPGTGACVDDPCNTIECPADQHCYRGQCNGTKSDKTQTEDPTKPQNKEGGDIYDGGPSNNPPQAAPGCQCDFQGVPSPLGGLLLLLVILLLLPRKPRSRS